MEGRHGRLAVIRTIHAVDQVPNLKVGGLLMRRKGVCLTVGRSPSISFRFKCPKAEEQVARGEVALLPLRVFMSNGK